MMIQEIKQGMKVRNAGGDVFEIMGTKGDLVIVKMLENNSSFIPVNFAHETFEPGKILEIDQTSEMVTMSGYCEVALEYLNPVEDVAEPAFPMFNVGDLVKDKFGNIFKVNAAVDAEIDPSVPGYDHMRYNLVLEEWGPTQTERMVGTFASFHRLGDALWIFNTEEDAKSEDYVVDEYFLIAAELELCASENSEEIQNLEVSEIPIFLEGDLVKDAFGNNFEVAEAKPSMRLDPDRFDYCNMGYRLKLIKKEPTSPARVVYDGCSFDHEGNLFWIYNREEDVREAEEDFLPYTITASELVLVKSVLLTKSKIMKPTKPTKPAKAEKAEIAKRYPSIEDLQKISEENDLGNLLDQAYAILKEQASLGERRSNLEAEKFKRCIPHFEREGFDITEHGMLIEVRW